MNELQDPKSEKTSDEEKRSVLPVEVELYIESDGTVTFADLAAEVIPIAQELNPDQHLACDVPGQGDTVSPEATELDTEDE